MIFHLTAIFVFKGMFSMLLKTADKFLEKFNIRRLKFGTIMEFLKKFNMPDSITAMETVLREIKVFSIKLVNVKNFGYLMTEQ